MAHAIFPLVIFLLAVLAVHLTGWAIASRIALATLMSEKACSQGLNFLENCRSYHGLQCAKPVGQLRDRTHGDAMKAIGRGLFWPGVIASHVLLAVTPPTVGELERRITEQAAEIDRLTRNINS